MDRDIGGLFTQETVQRIISSFERLTEDASKGERYRLMSLLLASVTEAEGGVHQVTKGFQSIHRAIGNVRRAIQDSIGRPGPAAPPVPR